MYLVGQSKPCAQLYLQKIACCINLQLPIICFVKLIISEMHYRQMYMYINFQQNWVSRSVKTVPTNIFAKIASCISLQQPIVLFLIDYLRHASSLNVHVYQFLTILSLQINQNRPHKSICKNCKWHKFATTYSNF